MKYQADAVIADASREFQMQKANYDMEVNAKVTCQYGVSFTLNEMQLSNLWPFCERTAVCTKDTLQGCLPALV